MWVNPNQREFQCIQGSKCLENNQRNLLRGYLDNTTPIFQTVITQTSIIGHQFYSNSKEIFMVTWVGENLRFCQNSYEPGTFVGLGAKFFFILTSNKLKIDSVGCFPSESTIKNIFSYSLHTSNDTFSYRADPIDPLCWNKDFSVFWLDFLWIWLFEE